MKWKLENLVRKNIQALKPYSSARDEYSSTAGIFLDANENSLGSVLAEGTNRYPDPKSKALRQALSRQHNLDVANVFVGNGSDECILLLLQIFAEAGRDKILVTPPTYGMYGVAAQIQGVEVLEAPLGSQFELDLDLLPRLIEPNLKIIFLCSPNNPTGNLLEREKIEKLLSNFSGIVVIDEAYIDFCEEQSWISSLKRYPNLVLLQTFSKAWGMAGSRVGLAFASCEIVSLLMKIKPPYNLDFQAQQAAARAVSLKEKKCAMVKELVTLRAELVISLEQLACVKKVYPSDANFVLVRFRDSSQIFNALKSAGIIVRDRSTMPGCENCLRITVGKASENQALLAVLREI